MSKRNFYKMLKDLSLVISTLNFKSIFATLTIFLFSYGVHMKLRAKNFEIAENLNINKKGPLYDIFHTYIDWWSLDNGKHTDYIIRYMVVSMIITFVSTFRLHLLVRFLQIYTCLFIFRTICMSITILPDITGKGKNTWINGGTNDLMFSGHAMLSTLLERFFIWYIVPPVFTFIPIICNILIMLNTVLTKRHYSIDVIIAWYVSFSFFHLVHIYYKTEYEIEDENNKILMESIL